MGIDSAIAWPQIASWTIDAADARFAGHFPEHVLVPGAYLLANAVDQIELTLGIRIDALRSVKFTEAATPGTRVALMAEHRGSQVRFALTDAHNANVLCSGLMIGRACDAKD